MADIHGVYHLADNPNIYQPQFTNNFEFVITGIDSLLRAGATGTDADADYLKNNEETLRLAISNAFIPSFQQQEISIKRGNTEMKFAGVPSFQSGSITFNDYVGAEISDRLLAWQALSCDIKNETVGLAKDYKKDAYLIEYNSDYTQVVRTWQLKGCWISRLDFGNVDYEQNNKKQVSATIIYDRAYLI